MHSVNPDNATTYFNINWYGFYPGKPLCDNALISSLATLRKIVHATVEDISFVNHNPVYHPPNSWTQLVLPAPSQFSMSATDFDNFDIASVTAEGEFVYGDEFHEHQEMKERLLILDTLHIKHPLTYKEKCHKWLNGIPLHVRPIGEIWFYHLTLLVWLSLMHTSLTYD